MSYIDIHQFDPAQVKCELVTTGPRNAGDKPKTQVKMSYGPNRRAIGFLTPPCVLDWPRLTGDGNLNTKYGPTEPDKAAYTTGLTDRPVPEIDAVGDPGGAMKRFFNVIREIDNALIAFVHANQRELLGVRDLTLDNIRGKANQTVKPKYDESGDLLIYERMNVATRKYTWSGQERSLKIADAKRQPLPEDQPPRHEDVASLAIQVDYTYVGPSMFGLKWAVTEAMLLKRSEGTSKTSGQNDAFADYDVPAWAH